MEVELQAILKSKWNNKIGGRANRQAESVVLNQLLAYDLNNFQIREYTSVDEDLKANYDRELAPFGARVFGQNNSHTTF